MVYSINRIIFLIIGRQHWSRLARLTSFTNSSPWTFSMQTSITGDESLAHNYIFANSDSLLNFALSLLLATFEPEYNSFPLLSYQYLLHFYTKHTILYLLHCVQLNTILFHCYHFCILRQDSPSAQCQHLILLKSSRLLLLEHWTFHPWPRLC